MIKRITMSDLWHIMFDFNEKHPEFQDSSEIGGVIVYKSDNWDTEYSEESRSYEVWNNNRQYQPDKIANSLFGHCLDGTDEGVRLDWYNWDVEYCYIYPEYISYLDPEIRSMYQL